MNQVIYRQIIEGLGKACLKGDRESVKFWIKELSTISKP